MIDFVRVEEFEWLSKKEVNVLLTTKDENNNEIQFRGIIEVVK